MRRPRRWTVLARALRLRCPACGQGAMHCAWNRMEPRCVACGLDFRVEPGFYLGSIYVNYGVTALLLTAAGVPIVLYEAVPWGVLTPVAVAFCVLFPLWFLRYARSLWFALDYYYDRSGVRRRKERALAIGSPPAPDGPAAPHRDEASTALPQSRSAPGSPSSTAICPHCHARFSFAPDQRHRWGACPACGASVLLVPQAGNGDARRDPDTAPR
jgi:uncharacterized protein (DUF983 family)/DNA-directed RNA polymerase subunit RPC12/RpoP